MVELLKSISISRHHVACGMYISIKEIQGPVQCGVVLVESYVISFDAPT